MLGFNSIICWDSSASFTNWFGKIEPKIFSNKPVVNDRDESHGIPILKGQGRVYPDPSVPMVSKLCSTSGFLGIITYKYPRAIGLIYVVGISHFPGYVKNRGPTSLPKQPAPPGIGLHGSFPGGWEIWFPEGPNRQKAGNLEVSNFSVFVSFLCVFLVLTMRFVYMIFLCSYLFCIDFFLCRFFCIG